MKVKAKFKLFSSQYDRYGSAISNDSTTAIYDRAATRNDGAATRNDVHTAGLDGTATGDDGTAAGDDGTAAGNDRAAAGNDGAAAGNDGTVSVAAARTSTSGYVSFPAVWPEPYGKPGTRHDAITSTTRNDAVSVTGWDFTAARHDLPASRHGHQSATAPDVPSTVHDAIPATHHDAISATKHDPSTAATAAAAHVVITAVHDVSTAGHGHFSAATNDVTTTAGDVIPAAAYDVFAGAGTEWHDVAGSRGPDDEWSRTKWPNDGAWNAHKCLPQATPTG